MADKKNRGAGGNWEEELFKSFNTPVSLLDADPNQDISVERDELGREIFETIGGQRYMVGEVKAPDSIPKTVKKIAEVIPPVEEWRLPTKEEVGKGLKEGGKAVVEGLWEVVKTPTNPDAALGDLFEVGGAMAAPGASKVLNEIDPTTLRTFFGPSSPKADRKKFLEAENLYDAGASDEEIWEKTGWWLGPNGWRFEVSDDTMELDPRIWDILKDQPLDGRGTQGPTENLVSHKDFWESLGKGNSNTSRYGSGDLKTKRSGTPAGGFYSQNGLIEAQAMSEKELKSIILHEMVHLEQFATGKAGKGFNPDYIGKDVKDTLDQMPREALEYLAQRKAFDKKEELLKDPKRKTNVLSSFIYRQIGDEGLKKAIAVHEVQKKAHFDKAKKVLGETFVEDLDEFYVGMGGFDPHLERTTAGWTRGDPAVTDRKRKISAFNKYEREVGEAEARAVQHRQDLTPEQRAKRHPKKDFDVPLEELYTAQDFIRMMNRLAISADNYNQNGPEPKFAEGGVVPENTQVPPGALPNEVADTVDIKASEGEYIIPANVVRFLGLDKLEKMVEQAKGKLGEMEAKGRMGDTSEEELPFTKEELMASDPVAPEGPPAFAEGGFVAGVDPTKDPNSTEVDPVTGLPLWMTNLQRGAVNTPAATPAQPATWSPNTGQQRERDSKAGEYGTELTGMAQSVHKWSPKDFNTYARTRNSVDQKVGQKLASIVPFGGLAVRAREKYLERNVPRSMAQMLEDKVDLQGNPLDATQIEELQQSYDRITKEALDKGFGYSQIAKKVAENSGLITKKTKSEKAEKQQKKNQEDSLINRVMDAVTKDRSKPEKTKTEKSSSDNSSSRASDRDPVKSKTSTSTRSSTSSKSNNNKNAQ